MKNVFTLLFSLTVAVFFTGAFAFAQGKGLGNGPSIGQGHGSGIGHDQVKTKSDVSGNKDNTDAKDGWETKFNQRIQNDSAFASKIQKLLPAGMDMKTAEDGFKNRGQFIAALHVSQNLNIPFDQLKAKMTGVSTVNGQQTTSTPVSLGKAIHELRPDMSQAQSDAQAKIADKQAAETVKPTQTASN
jgi:hypothetical protein